MSHGPWRRDGRTGIALTQVEKCDEGHLDDNGNLNLTRWSDADLFDVRSIAAVAGFADSRYFCNVVLEHPDNPFHIHRLKFCDHTGRIVAETIATHTTSAQIGGVIWQNRKRTEARLRGMASQLNGVSFVTVLTSPNDCGHDMTLS